jgi:transcriptional regulator with XRE-family HTH domain
MCLKSFPRIRKGLRTLDLFEMRAKLREFRVAAGYTQNAAASSVLDMSASKIARLESGVMLPRRRDLIALLDLYGVTDETVVGGMLEAMQGELERRSRAKSARYLGKPSTRPVKQHIRPVPEHAQLLYEIGEYVNDVLQALYTLNGYALANDQPKVVEAINATMTAARRGQNIHRHLREALSRDPQ